MKTIFSDPVFFMPFVGNPVPVGMGGHCLMKGCVKNRDLRQMWEFFSRHMDSQSVCRGMNGSDVFAGGNCGLALIVEQNAFIEFFPAIDDPVTYGIQMKIGEMEKHLIKRLGMTGRRDGNNLFVSICGFDLDQRLF